MTKTQKFVLFSTSVFSISALIVFQLILKLPFILSFTVSGITIGLAIYFVFFTELFDVEFDYKQTIQGKLFIPIWISLIILCLINIIQLGTNLDNLLGIIISLVFLIGGGKILEVL